MRVPTFLALLVASHGALADIKFTTPEAGATIKAGSPFTVTWDEGSNSPSLSEVLSYTLVLYSGSNAHPSPVTTLVASGKPSTKAENITIEAGVGGSTTNAYFLGMTMSTQAIGYVINYSDRFTVSGMSGSFTPDVEAALSSVTGTAGPADLLLDDGASRLEIRQAALPFNEQVGPTRFASMQPVPGTSITAQNTAPLFPTSSVVIATTFLPVPTVQTTVTAAQTNVVVSKANTAAAAPQPSDDFAKFLNRWKD